MITRSQFRIENQTQYESDFTLQMEIIQPIRIQKWNLGQQQQVEMCTILSYTEEQKKKTNALIINICEDMAMFWWVMVPVIPGQTCEKLTLS